MSRNRVTSILNSIFPWLRKLLKYRIIDEQVNDFFVNLVKDTVQYRETNQVTRNDFLDLLIALRNDTSMPQSDEIKGAGALDKKFGKFMIFTR